MQIVVPPQVVAGSHVGEGDRQAVGCAGTRRFDVQNPSSAFLKSVSIVRCKADDLKLGFQFVVQRYRREIGYANTQRVSQ